MKTRVCSGPDVAAVLRCVDDEIASGFRPTLAIVFCSVAHDVSAAGRQFAERGMAVVGVTTAGEIANVEVLEDACAAMLLDIDPDAFAVQFKTTANGASMTELAQQLGRYAVERFAHPTVITFVSGIKSNGEDVVHGVRTGAGRAIPLFGGMAGDDLIMENTYVFSGDGVTEEGLIGLVLDGDRFEVEGIATSGWQPVGVEKTITRSEANRVYTIDGEPALDVYKQYLNVEVQEDRQESVAVNIGVQYPLSVRREDGTSVIRAPLLYNSDIDAIIFAGGVPEGARVKFCIPPSLDIVERVVEEATEVQQSMPDAEALILVACIARHMALGPLSEDEIHGLYDLWKAPMLGYFSYGEIGAREPQHCDLHTETCVLVALREVRA